MNGSISSTTRITVGYGLTRNSIRTGQWYNVESRLRGTRTTLYTPVSCGTGHFFRDTRIMPYAFWGSECPSEKAPALGENAFWSCVPDRTGIDREWMKKFEGGRSGTNWNCATEDERQRWRDEQTKQERVRSNIHNWGTNPVSFLRNNDLSLEFWAEEIAICLGNSSLFNQQSTRRVNGWTEIGEEQTELIFNRR